MNQQYQRAQVEAIHFWTPNNFSIRLATKKTPLFIAGQYIRVALEISSELLIRPYSIVSAPYSPIIELYVTALPDTNEECGALSSKLRELQIGDSVWLSNQTYGYLTIDEVPQANKLWLLASGVGLAPFVSILREGTVFEKFQSVFLAHSVRYISELGYTEELEHLSKVNRLTYIRCVTRESVNKNYLTGRITDNLENGFLEQKANSMIQVEDSQCMLCGSPAMIDDCNNLLKRRGLIRNRRHRRGQITVEKFW